ncbi:MAG: hypothetical protein L0G99_07305 [Propionibacteriales bacterium]|nr:hypothetical protein [Propionibacteriales bacterium]
MSSIALVESPAQLLNTIEWATADASRMADLAIVVLAPRESTARFQLHRLTEMAAASGLVVHWQEARRGRTARLQIMVQVAPAVRRARQIVVGDPFSRMIQTLLLGANASEVVLVDDGSSTLHFVECWRAKKPIVRWHRSEVRPADRALGVRFARKLAATRLSLFTVMPVPDPVLTVERNAYVWTRAQHLPPQIEAGSDLVGTSLVETGVVELEHYVQAVQRLVERYEVVRYYAHRRESSQKLRRLAAIGLHVITPDLPMELMARVGPIGSRIITFPSTLVHTLPRVLDGTGVEIVVIDVEPAWLSAATSSDSAAFLRSITSSARTVATPE